jgi:hypothetical protein
MDSRSARSADPTSRQLKVAGTCHPLCDLAKLIGEPNHLANGRDAVAPLPQDNETVQRCKSERSSCAKVQRSESFQVAGGGPGWRVAGRRRGRGATAWRPWADGHHKAKNSARLTYLALRTDATQSRPYLNRNIAMRQCKSANRPAACAKVQR